ncbi:AI-2E family transporter [Planococcus lenghuensis]|uniref:AI-2E family transporter n=1 Tax=Planococcus lenghuensis TaxID=2213202 RepID=A0A1Q2KZE0_9BACL|nr:AI-2E family transporter [Planococcus lenghuensis]AQQ53494.1 AI-2E family transporter [Planococcus lenghuensis]
MKQDRPSFFGTKIIAFLGGRDTLFMLTALVLTGLVILVFTEVSFIFGPLIIFFETVVLPVVVSLILYYLLRPLVHLLERGGLSRGWGILLLFLGGTGLITLLIILVFPFLQEQLLNFVAEFPLLFEELLTGADAFLGGSIIGGFYTDSGFDIDRLMETLPENVGDTLQNMVSGVVSGLTGFITTVTAFVVSIVIVPFVLFYLLKDGEKLPKHLIHLLPPRFREDFKEVLHEADHQLSGYIQGQIIVAFFIGVMVTIGFLIIGLDYAFLLGALAMVTSVIPYIGPAIAFTPAVILALVVSPFMLLKVIIVWTIVQLAEGNLISPQVMGKRLEIHPVTVIFVLLTAGALFGFVGIVLGVPIYALIRVVVTHLFKLFKRRYNKYEPVPENQYEKGEA